MTFKRIIKTLFVCYIIFSCNSMSRQPDKTRKGLTEFQAIFVNMRSNADKLVFKRYYLNPDSNITGDYTNVVWADSTNDLKKIADFNHLLTGIQDRGYCCCLRRHYTISFYKGKQELGYYCADTASPRNMVTLFDESYQTSYCIDLTIWNSYLQNK